MTVLSDPAGTVQEMRPRARWHPWRVLGTMDVEVVWERRGGLGAWCEKSRRMFMDPRQSQVERRCTATHEIVHAERGHDGCQPEAVEASVRREAARRLILLHDLADAVLFYGEDWPAVAHELWVDLPTLMTRLRAMHPAEKGYINRCLRAREEAA